MATTTTTAKTLEVTPYLIVQNADGLIDFVKDVFDAEELTRSTGSQGGTHCELRLSGTKVMIGGGKQVRGREKPAALHVFVPNVDAAYRRAINAGAKSLMPPRDQEYQARDGAVQDAFGNHWYIATQKGEHYAPAGMPNVMPYFHPRAAGRLIDFLQSGLGAEVIERHDAGGVVAHAKMRLGATVVELGEAHGQWRPMPMVMFVNVDDADAAFARAVAAGATALSEPADLPYGRSGAVEDDFGNQWYLTAMK
jgi:PhnB protein